MKISILTENSASNHFQAEHGLSYFIENDKTVLFDTGWSDLFLKNAAKLSIDVNLAKTIVLSHGHWDHGNGLSFISGKKLICHPYALIKRYRKSDNSYIGLDLSLHELQKRFTLVQTKLPLQISQNILYLGEIPRANNFESQLTPFIDEHGNDDFVPDDSGLAITTNNELIIISGCAHSGICNMIDYARRLTKIDKIKAIIGGFHLKNNELQISKTIDYLKKLDIGEMYPSHCTELPALSAFYAEFKSKQLKAGMVLEF